MMIHKALHLRDDRFYLTRNGKGRGYTSIGNCVDAAKRGWLQQPVTAITTKGKEKQLYR